MAPEDRHILAGNIERIARKLFQEKISPEHARRELTALAAAIPYSLAIVTGAVALNDAMLIVGK